MDTSLGVLGVGAYLPQVRPVRELVLAAGGDPATYDGWPNSCVASDEEQPSMMAARALSSALEKSGVSASQLSLLVSCGFSRDYLPTWSLSTEVMQKLSAPSTCLGLDTTIGCVGVLTGLELVRGWLATNGGGYAAIVAAEKWSQSIDRKGGISGLWANGDGAGAAVVGLRVPGTPIARYRGAVFSSHAEFNGLVLVKYGGTRYPVAPPGVDPFTRQVRQVAPSELWASYRAGYERAFRGLAARFEREPRRLVCNQIAPRFVTTIGELAGVSADRICRTGPEYGHVGSADLLLGLMQLSNASAIDGPIALAGSTPYAFGAALVEAV
jgi:3-oxoacyl-[acyl-carrier-protein] synthase III